MIYFIAKPDRSAIKIGRTIRLSQRLKRVVAEHGPGLEVLAVTEGSFEAERELHGRFAHLRSVGEWFDPGDDLVGFIVSDGRQWDGADEEKRSTSDRVSMPSFTGGSKPPPIRRAILSPPSSGLLSSRS